MRYALHLLPAIAILLMAQMSPEEAAKALQEADSPTPAEIAAMREELADLRRENAALEARVATLTKRADEPAKAGPVDTGRITTVKGLVAALPSEVQSLGDTLAKAYEGREIVLPAKLFDLHGDQAQGYRMVLNSTGNTINGVPWDVSVASTSRDTLPTRDTFTCLVKHAHVRMSSNPRTGKYALRLLLNVEIE